MDTLVRPVAGGRSLQRAPEHNTHSTPLTKVRLPAAVRPVALALLGRRSSIRSHCVWVN